MWGVPAGCEMGISKQLTWRWDKLEVLLVRC